MPKRDPHEVLGVPQNASFEEIRDAFRKLARHYHPDINKEKSAYARFKEINEAYEELTRDRPQASGEQVEIRVPAGWAGAFEDYLHDIFSVPPEKPRLRPRGGDVRVPLLLSEQEAANGVEKDIEFQRAEICSECGGSGAMPGTSPVKCSTCAGYGQVRQARTTKLGRMVTSGTCLECDGWGETIPKPCGRCKATRLEKQKTRLTVRIPAGVKTGAEIRLTEQGEASPRGGERGTLYLVVEIKQNS
jgi:molecular chaperone DnaJ